MTSTATIVTTDRRALIATRLFASSVHRSVVIAPASKIDTPAAPPATAISTVCVNAAASSGLTNRPLYTGAFTVRTASSV